MARWEPINASGALELLNPSFSQPSIRTFAVEALNRISDKVCQSYYTQTHTHTHSLSLSHILTGFFGCCIQELSFYLLMLVQGLRYEPPGSTCLGEFLISRATQNQEIGTSLYWYLTVEGEDPQYGAMYTKRLRALTLALSKARVIHTPTIHALIATHIIARIASHHTPPYRSSWCLLADSRRQTNNTAVSATARVCQQVERDRRVGSIIGRSA
jgi:hypothetical protein